ncbi:MAG: VCBS repeat-containing protein, partial [Chloroflexi bacterium]|nr:VCBS repeat-containing protein [Chloroflexota bacterium]
WSRHHVADLWGARTIATADLTGNGLPDLIVGSVTLFGQPDGVVWYRHHSSGDPWSGANSIDMTLGNVETVLTHDVDGDTDVAVSSNDAAALRWYENDSGWTSHDISSYSGVTGFATGDLDGNGSPDLITTTYANNFGTDRLDWWQNQ